jgi:hypothetical protein
MVYTLQIFLGNYPAKRFPEVAPQRLMAKYREKLQSIAREIDERNKEVDIPYTYMLPKKIPNSITI